MNDVNYFKVHYKSSIFEALMNLWIIKSADYLIDR